MNNPWDQDGLDDDDFVEGIDDEEEDELGIDYTARHGGQHPLEDDEDVVPLGRPNHGRPERPAARSLPARAAAPRKGGRKFRIRAMSERMARSRPNVASILITKDDGSQVLLVRRGR